MKKPKLPSVFIGSSSAGLPVARAVQVELESRTETTIWSQGVFGLSSGTLEDLVRAAEQFEYAVLVLTPDDLTVRSDQTANSPRDNVIFELGLFTGALGRERTFIVYCHDSKLALPSDLAGVTAATYASRRDDNLQAAVGPACTKIMQAISSGVGKAKPWNRSTASLESITIRYETRVHRARAKIAVIDDEPFKHAPFLTQSGFAVTEMRDISDLEALLDYAIVVCDIRGVGAAFGEDLGGAYLLQRIRERFPDIYLASFTRYPNSPRLLRLLQKADENIPKELNAEDWVSKLDALVALMIDPAARWKRLRRLLLDNYDLLTVWTLEQHFVHAIHEQAPCLELAAPLPGLSPEHSTSLVRRIDELLLSLDRIRASGKES